MSLVATTTGEIGLIIESEQIGQLYWQTRHHRLHNNPEGKWLAVQAAVTAIKSFSNQEEVRVLALGCGHGELLTAVSQQSTHDNIQLTGVDMDEQAIAYATATYPAATFYHADYTTTDWTTHIEPPDIILLVNSLHEVYSTAGQGDNGRINHRQGQTAVSRTLTNIAALLAPNGYLIIFDGVAPTDGQDIVTVQFKQADYAAELHKFSDEYLPFPIQYTFIDEQKATISKADLAHYLLKTLFFNTVLWEVEQHESYFYFTPAQFDQVLRQLGMQVQQKQLTRPSLPNWQQRLSLLTPNAGYPYEHILLIAQRVEE